MISVDATIVNVALPTLSRELNADTAQLQWIVDAYTLVMSGLLLSAGSLSDRYGRRGWLSAGLLVFAMTSAVAAQVNSAGALIAARAAMGVGAAVIFPTTLAIDHQHLHRAGSAGQSDRPLGGHGRGRRGRRPDNRRLAA